MQNTTSANRRADSDSCVLVNIKHQHGTRRVQLEQFSYGDHDGKSRAQVADDCQLLPRIGDLLIVSRNG